MEYKRADGEYKGISGNEITGLEKGEYYIRFKETEFYQASLDKLIIIDEPAVIRIDETVPQDINLETPIQTEDKLEINVAKANEAAPEIKNIANKKAMPMVLEITAKVNNIPVSTLSHLIKITLPLPEDAKGKNITIYRLHEGKAEEIPIGEANKNADGEYAIVGADNVVIFAKNFSQYVIAYQINTNNTSGAIGKVPRHTVTVTQSEGGKITPETTSVNNTGSQKVIITPDEGFEIKDVIVNGKSVGKVLEYTFHQITSTSTITAIFQKIIDEPNDTWKNPFTDVAENSWYYKAVKFVNEAGLMMGIGSTTFAPNINVTRAMFVTILYRMENEPNVDISIIPFTEVESGSYYEKAVAWTNENGIIKGVSETEFAPNDTITREQMAAIIYRYAIFKGLDISTVNDTSYADSADISDYAKEAVAFCTENGIMNGVGSGQFAPKSFATRAEITAVIERVMKILK